MSLQSWIDCEAAGSGVHGGNILHVLDVFQSLLLAIVPVLVVQMLVDRECVCVCTITYSHIHNHIHVYISSLASLPCTCISIYIYIYLPNECMWLYSAIGVHLRHVHVVNEVH